MRELRFYMEKNGNWYVDLPEWKGTKAQLRMVEGADALLDLMDENDKGEVMVMFSEQKFENAECLHLVEVNKGVKIFPKIIFFSEKEFGADYLLTKYKGVEIMGFKVWLCNVMKFVFGYFPVEIYFKTK
jgi:hypothetical protein